jgi:Flp pilus assembly protein TadD
MPITAVVSVTSITSITSVVSPVAAVSAVSLTLSAAGQAQAQTPRQSRLAPTPQSSPQDAAQAALKAGNPQRALEIAETALKTFPNDAQLRFARGVALHQLNRLPEAETAFAEMTLTFPELPEPYNNLAVVRAAQGQLEQARSALEDAVRAVPGYAVAHENLGDIHAQLAARSYRNAQKLDPANRTVGPKLKLVSEAAGPNPGTTSPVQPSSAAPAAPAAPAVPPSPPARTGR